MSARDLRLLFVVVGAVVFVDTMFYAAVAPLLPALSRELALSKASAGVLTAGYAVGTLIGSLPGGMLAEHAGPRVTLYAGLSLLAGSSLAFGLLNDIALLDIARFAQGIGGACSWSGGLVWLIAEVPADRRGGAIGASLSAAIGGALFGPVIGTLAHALGRGVVFSAVVVVAGALIIAVRALPGSPVIASEQKRPRLSRALRQPTIALGMWLTAIPAIASGSINVLGPLRLGALGASAAGVGATYLVAAAAEAVVSPLAGRLSDRRGRIVPLRMGLLSATLVLVCFSVPRSVVPLALVIVLAAVALGIFWAPAMAMLSDAAEQHGLGQGYALALINLAWAAGQIVGSAGGGALAKSAGDEAPFAIAAGLCAITLGLIAPYPFTEKLESGLISRRRE